MRKQKRGGKHFLGMFLLRHQDMSNAHDKLILTMRLAREMLASRDGTAETWIELAGLLNVCGLFANAKDRPDWYNVLHIAADALRAIEGRHRRVGGRYAGTEQEVADLTHALNLIDADLLPEMTMVEFTRYAMFLEEQARLARDAETV